MYRKIRSEPPLLMLNSLRTIWLNYSPGALWTVYLEAGNSFSRFLKSHRFPFLPKPTLNGTSRALFISARPNPCSFITCLCYASHVHVRLKVPALFITLFYNAPNWPVLGTVMYIRPTTEIGQFAATRLLESNQFRPQFCTPGYSFK